MSKVTFDGTNKLIIIDNNVTTINVRLDLYDEWLLWSELPENVAYLPAFTSIGGDDPLIDIAVSGSFYLLNGWRLRPYEGEHELNVIGSLYVNGGGNPFVKTIGAYNVLINMVSASILSTVYVDRNGLTEQDKTDVVLGVGSLLQSLKTDLLNSLTPKIDRILGLVQSNFKFYNQSYNSKGNLTSGNMKIYPTSTDLQMDRNAISEYRVVAIYDTDNLLTDYIVTEL